MAHVRPARHDDVVDMLRIAAAGGSPDADEHHLDVVASLGRLVVVVEQASGGDEVVGFGGGVVIGDAVMVTDLFVDPDHRGRGIGAAALAAVVDGHPRRMTCSSTHPAALAAYRSVGMTPQWRLLTVRGRATGGGPPLATSPWRHDRRELIEYFRSRGAIVSGDRVVATAVDPAGTTVHTVWRLVADEPEVAGTAILAALPAGDVVEMSVPEPNRFARWLLEHDFETVDHDVFCATDGVHLVPQVRSVHRGLL